ncbi:hypothetical protein K2W90_00160 [Candidatus Babeliales bacterium]|nr:hypothetical protein [Candidatus Babeliales bacterium]
MKKYILLLAGLLLLQASCFAAQPAPLDFNKLQETLQKISREELYELVKSFEEKSAENTSPILYTVFALALGMFTIDLCLRVHNTMCGSDTTPCFQPDGLLQYFPKILNFMCNEQTPIQLSPTLERIFL